MMFHVAGSAEFLAHSWAELLRLAARVVEGLQSFKILSFTIIPISIQLSSLPFILSKYS